MVAEPNNTEAEYYRLQAEALQNEIDKRPQAQKRVDDAVAMVEEAKVEWNAIAIKKTPGTNPAGVGINLNVNAWDLTVTARQFRNNVQRLVNKQVKAGGVTVEQGPEIPIPDAEASTILANYFNYPAIAFPVVIFNSSGIQVRGSYRQITDNVRAWKRMPNFLAVADGLAIQGTSPELTGTYNLTIVGYIRGQQIYAPVPTAAGGGTGARGPGGPPQGFGGGPPQGFGGPPPGFGPGGPGAANRPPSMPPSPGGGTAGGRREDGGR